MGVGGKTRHGGGKRRRDCDRSCHFVLICVWPIVEIRRVVVVIPGRAQTDPAVEGRRVMAEWAAKMAPQVTLGDRR
jgi:hypothetical protein